MVNAVLNSTLVKIIVIELQMLLDADLFRPAVSKNSIDMANLKTFQKLFDFKTEH